MRKFKFPEPIGEYVRRELKRFGPSGAMAEIVRAWPAAVGESIARNAWPARWRPARRPGRSSSACSQLTSRAGWPRRSAATLRWVCALPLEGFPSRRPSQPRLAGSGLLSRRSKTGRKRRG
jgi:hypothetical protein